MTLNASEKYIEEVAKRTGLKRWEDPSRENIPATKLDESYHLEFGSYVADTMTHCQVGLRQDVTLTFWKRGYKDPEEGRRQAMAIAEKFVVDVLKYKNYIGNDVKSVILNSITPTVLRSDNDNVTQVEISLTMGINLGF